MIIITTTAAIIAKLLLLQIKNGRYVALKFSVSIAPWAGARVPKKLVINHFQKKS